MNDWKGGGANMNYHQSLKRSQPVILILITSVSIVKEEEE